MPTKIEAGISLDMKGFIDDLKKAGQESKNALDLINDNLGSLKMTVDNRDISKTVTDTIRMANSVKDALNFKLPVLTYPKLEDNLNKTKKSFQQLEASVTGVSKNITNNFDDTFTGISENSERTMKNVESNYSAMSDNLASVSKSMSRQWENTNKEMSGSVSNFDENTRNAFGAMNKDLSNNFNQLGADIGITFGRLMADGQVNVENVSKAMLSSMLDTAQKAILTYAPQIFGAFASLGPWGVPLGLAAIGTMEALMMTAKSALGGAQEGVADLTRASMGSPGPLDNIPMLLSEHEAVVNAAAATANRTEIEWMNRTKKPISEFFKSNSYVTREGMLNLNKLVNSDIPEKVGPVLKKLAQPDYSFKSLIEVDSYRLYYKDLIKEIQKVQDKIDHMVVKTEIEQTIKHEFGEVKIDMDKLLTGIVKSYHKKLRKS